MGFHYKLSFAKAAAMLERRRVALVLKEFGLEHRRSELLEADYCAGSGDRRLSFAAFDTVFPDFPICLEVRQLYRLVHHTTCSQTAMFRDFRRHIAYQAYHGIREVLAERCRGRPLGMLYCWQGIKHGLVLHDGDFPSEGFKQTFVDGKERLTVEPFRLLIRTLVATGWTPKSPSMPPALSTELPRCPTPWQLTRLVKDAAELRLLALLLEVLFHLPAAKRRRYVVRREGERWIAITQKRLAATMKVSERTVQRSIAELEKNGLIATRKNEYHQNEIQICPQVFQWKENAKR
jgi:hypothetical protein